MLSINITTQPMKMQFGTQQASLDITNAIAQVQLETPAAKLDIHQSSGELTIDQTPCRYARGIKNMMAFNRDNAQAGRESAVAAVGRIAEDGNRLGRIQSKENVIANMAADSMVPEPAEITWAYVPMPEIHYTPKAPQINLTEGKVTNSSQPGKVQGDYRPAQVNINVAQYPSITMWVSDKKLDTTV